mgnify:CR=1 FL=1
MTLLINFYGGPDTGKSTTAAGVFRAQKILGVNCEMALEYSKDKINAISGKSKDAADVQKNLLPTYYINSNFFESVFGGNTIEVNPQGSILVKMGLIFQKVENPQLSENNRQSTTFDFDQEISASLNAKIGDRLKVTANFDTQSTFNFQNMVKLEYTPTEDDIIRKIEIGKIEDGRLNCC